MQQQVRCKKCGRVLKSPASIAMGMGPKCAGVTGGGKSVRVRAGRRGGVPYGLGKSSGMPATFPTGEARSKRMSKREQARHDREERQRLFDERLPFQCGLLLPERKPIIYTPTEDGGWKNNTSGCVIPHEQLQNYLKRYQFI